MRSGLESLGTFCMLRRHLVHQQRLAEHFQSIRYGGHWCHPSLRCEQHPEKDWVLRRWGTVLYVRLGLRLFLWPYVVHRSQSMLTTSRVRHLTSREGARCQTRHAAPVYSLCNNTKGTCISPLHPDDVEFLTEESERFGAQSDGRIYFDEFLQLLAKRERQQPGEKTDPKVRPLSTTCSACACVVRLPWGSAMPLSRLGRTMCQGAAHCATSNEY